VHAWVLMVLGLAALITGAELLVRGGARHARCGSLFCHIQNSGGRFCCQVWWSILALSESKSCGVIVPASINVLASAISCAGEQPAASRIYSSVSPSWRTGGLARSNSDALSSEGQIHPRSHIGEDDEENEQKGAGSCARPSTHNRVRYTGPLTDSAY
jgi:hypothetical protein